MTKHDEIANLEVLVEESIDFSHPFGCPEELVLAKAIHRKKWHSMLDGQPDESEICREVKSLLLIISFDLLMETPRLDGHGRSRLQQIAKGLAIL